MGNKTPSVEESLASIATALHQLVDEVVEVNNLLVNLEVKLVGIDRDNNMGKLVREMESLNRKIEFAIDNMSNH